MNNRQIDLPCAAASSDASSTHIALNTLALPAAPTHDTAFFARSDAESELLARLHNENCRLLTLVGPGGIGKTRLAIRVSTQSHFVSMEQRQPSICFVALQPISEGERLPFAVASALQLSLGDQEEPLAQLAQHLAGRTLLLVLDNAEHLLDACAALVEALLPAAPNVKVLLTSRVVLNLQEEWVYQVRGLSYPAAGQEAKRRAAPPILLDGAPFEAADVLAEGWDEETLQSFGAVQLFADRAKRVRHDFNLTDEADDVVRICRLVEGMPLAIELAAAWAKTLSCAAIADEITHSVNFLSTRLRNIPAQHRSIEAVCAQSWKLLSDEAQDVFQKLAVFRGGFDRTAAEAVAGASLGTISELLDSSLLRRCTDEALGNDRYELHELLRQFAEEKLHRNGATAQKAHDRHSRYFTSYLHARHDDLLCERQHEACRELVRELENVRVAWRWALAQGDLDALDRGLEAFYLLIDFRSLYNEDNDSIVAAEAAVQRAEPTPAALLLLARIRVCLGWNFIRLGQYDRSRAASEGAQQNYAQLGHVPPSGFGTDPRLSLGLLAQVLGDYGEAEALAGEALAAAEAREDAYNAQIALYILGNANFSQGNGAAAQRFSERAYALTMASGNRWMAAYVLSDLGAMANARAEYEQASRYFRESYEMKERLDDRQGMASALYHLGTTELSRGQREDALDHYCRSAQIYHRINDRGGLASALAGLGRTHLANDNDEQANYFLRHALQIATEIKFTSLTLHILLDAATYFGRKSVAQPWGDETEAGLRNGRAWSVELLALVLHHSASEHATREAARALLAEYEQQMARKAFGAAVQRGTARNLNETLRAVKIALISPAQSQRGESKTEAATGAETNTAPQSDGEAEKADALIEPLTEREQEVLSLIATGLSNKEIASELIISTGTVKWYTGQIYGKLGVAKRTQAVARARELALLN